jgi:hypothetical protein
MQQKQLRIFGFQLLIAVANIRYKNQGEHQAISAQAYPHCSSPVLRVCCGTELARKKKTREERRPTGNAAILWLHHYPNTEEPSIQSLACSLDEVIARGCFSCRSYITYK